MRARQDASTRRFADTGRSRWSGLDATRPQARLQALNAAKTLSRLGQLKSLGLHKLTGYRAGHWALTINGPYRPVFRFEDGDAYDVEIVDYRSGPTAMMYRETHPGTVLKDEPESRNFSAAALALRLGRYFGNKPEFWLAMQTADDLAILRKERGALIAPEVEVTSRSRSSPEEATNAGAVGAPAARIVMSFSCPSPSRMPLRHQA